MKKRPGLTTSSAKDNKRCLSDGVRLCVSTKSSTNAHSVDTEVSPHGSDPFPAGPGSSACGRRGPRQPVQPSPAQSGPARPPAAPAPEPVPRAGLRPRPCRRRAPARARASPPAPPASRSAVSPVGTVPDGHGEARARLPPQP